ncbi:MAG: heavy metal translocating P-type ATPase, partial [Proteobacteria bacterium]
MTRNNDTAACFHCGLPADRHAAYSAVVDGVTRPMCCAGCAAVARAIDSAGLSGYYRHRTANPKSPRDLVPVELERLAVYDHEEIQKSFVQTRTGSERRANLVLEDIQCAACIWLNERHLKTLPGVIDVSINYSTQQASVTWDNDRIRLSEILAAVRAIGYEAHPYDPNRQQLLLEKQRRKLLKQLGVAAAVGMQVMILTVALYTGEWYGMEPEFEQFFRKFSLLLTIPVLFYSGNSFFRNAMTDLKLRRVSMDVPVSIGIALAFGASALHVAVGEGAIYFESVCMFVLFLLAARYFELMSRTRAMLAAESIGYIKPSTARRVDVVGNGDASMIPALELVRGDTINVLPGETIPVDGIIVSGKSGVDEAV